jgi:hypothetical protein
MLFSPFSLVFGAGVKASSGAFARGSFLFGGMVESDDKIVNVWLVDAKLPHAVLTVLGKRKLSNRPKSKQRGAPTAHNAQF